MKIEDAKLKGVLIIRPPTIFEDFRGSYIETYNEKLYHQNGIDLHFVQDDISTSQKHVLRGIHGDEETWKLISCLYGKFYLVVVNADETSQQFRKWEAFTLSDINRLQVLIPPKFGNGHLVMSQTAVFHYKQTSYYNPKGQFTIKWNDPDYNIWWPVKEPIISRRDDFGGFVEYCAPL